MSRELPVLKIDLQLCLGVTVTLGEMKSTRKATAAEGDGNFWGARLGRTLQPPAAAPCGLCEESSPVRRSTVPCPQARIVP